MRFITNKMELTREQAEELLVKPKQKIAIDIETVSIENPLPLGIGVAVSGDIGFYFFNLKDPLLERVFASTDIVITHNGRFDLALLKAMGYVVKDYEDTKLIAYSGGILDNSLEALSLSILGRECPSVTSQWRKPNQGNIAIDHVKMGGMCIIHSCNTFALEERLPKTNLYYDIDKPSLALVMEMEYWGILIDQYMLTRVEQKTMERALPMEASLKEELHVENLGSNPQVAQALRDMGIVGTRKTKSDKDSVSNDSLKPLNLEVTNRLLKWRSLMKTLSTYVPAFRNKIDHNGRLHTKFGLTNTGRWSSSGPNLQNITRDEKFKEED
jgi:DNA polymerase I-like protein with 3'-5' exonuclease and polymerase domains